MTLSRFLLPPLCLSALLFTGCPTDGRRDTFDYLRSPVTFGIDPAADNHPFCSDEQNIGPDKVFATTQECQQTRKYRLRWERPEDTVGFSEYRVYMDTTPPNAPGLSWTDVRKDPALASFILPGRPTASDSIIFVLGANGSSPSALTRASGIQKLDTTGRLDASGRLVFAISTVYSQAGLNGQPRYTWVITNDRFPPNPIQPVFAPGARSVDIRWSRPRDPTSFFDSKADSGIILRYVLRVVRGGGIRIPPVPFQPVVTSYIVGGVNRTADVVVDSAFETGRGAPGLQIFLPDSQSVRNRSAEDILDSLKVTLGNIAPQDTVDISLWAMDLYGNINPANFGAVTVRLTDTTQPTTPVPTLIAGSLTRNGFAYSFTASRDRVEGAGGLVPAANPNANILEYRISRRRLDSPSTPPVDSVFKIPASQRGQESFTDTVRYLPPGARYRITVRAVDSSGYLSLPDSIDVTTPPAAFTGADTLATCPAGFIPMPSGRFQLGSTAGISADENAQSHYIGSYCIEPYEHRTGLTAGAFQTQVTWEQARDICAAVSPANGSHLCTEAEWERACEGTEAVPLTYGVQSEQRDPAGVRYTCNIGTNDSAMAGDINLRDPTCLSRDGAFDLAGNLAEWVMDPHTPTYPASPDTLVPGQPLTTPTASSRRGFRGTHYLNPNLNATLLLQSARCSNRDYATQRRPLPYPGCTDPLHPKLVVTYSDRAPRCFTLPDSLQGADITSLQPARDTNDVLILIRNRTKPVTFTMPPPDTAYKGRKPTSALLAPRALAVVTFENSETSEAITDTLDATEILNASPAGLVTLFTREAAPPWSVRKAGGQYEIRYLYSYAATQTPPARKYYSNKVIGFRCCSNPVPASTAKRRALRK